MPKKKGMITVDHIHETISTEHDPVKFSQYITELSKNEPEAFTWFTNHRMEEIARLSASFGELFQIFPTLPVYLNGLLLSVFYRGFRLAEAKWKPEITVEGVGMPDSEYQPKIEDF